MSSKESEFPLEHYVYDSNYNLNRIRISLMLFVHQTVNMVLGMELIIYIYLEMVYI